jgi:hypothetical protein
MSQHLQRQHSRQLEDVGSLLVPTLKRRNTKTESLYIIPFEIHAYEALLMTVKALETQEFTYVHDKIQSALQYFKDAALIPIKVGDPLSLFFLVFSSYSCCRFNHKSDS